MIKKLNLSRMLILVSFVTLFALSCKKDISEDPINNAKNWYLQFTEKSKTSIKSNKDATENVTTDFIWNNAKIFKFTDGKEVVATPIKVKLSNKQDAIGSYLLLVYKTNNVYQSLIIYNKKNDYFNDTISNSDIEAAFMVTIKNNELKSSAKSKEMPLSVGRDKTMLVDNNPVCIDWYLTTYTYDNWGNVIAILSETYLYTTCTEPPGGGGGGSCACITPPDESIDFGEPVSIAEFGTTETELIIGIDSFKVKPLNWTYHNAYTWVAKSTERGVVRIKNGNRTWHNLTHISSTDEGFWAIGDIDVYTSTFTPHITPGYSSHPSMDVDYQLIFKPGIAGYNGPGIKSSVMNSVASWDVNFIKN